MVTSAHQRFEPAAPDFAARRFQSVGDVYLAGRAPYPPGLIARAAQVMELRPDDRLLDLGCGPAQLSVAFAPYVGAVLAMDPEPVMLELARRATADEPKIVVRPGGSGDLGPDLGRFRAAVIGRAFHWMDRPETLRRLDELLEPDGAVALLRDHRLALPQNEWAASYRAFVDRWSEDDQTRNRRQTNPEGANISVLLESVFSRLEYVSVITQRTLGIGELEAHILSQSSTSRARLGERADDMLAELRAAAAEWSAEGRFTEVLRSDALIAWRS
jgi:SAM-dependent methyltransferase